MQNKQQLTTEAELMDTLRLVTQSYEEIAVMRMQRIRDSVLHMRVFIGEVAQVYVDVKTSYRNTISVVEKNGKTVAALITTNSKMNGDIISKVFFEFYEYVNTHECDLIIAGKMGRQLYEQMPKKKPYTFFELEENQITNASLRELIIALLPYKEIDVFYGKFESLLSQNATLTNISGDAKDVEKKANAKPVFYLFEPHLNKIMEFFETQIFASLVKQTINEAELARYASRIHAMEDAGQHIEKKSKMLNQQKNKLKKIISNKKQLEIMSRVMVL